MFRPNLEQKGRKDRGKENLSTHCHKYDDVFVAVCIFVSHDGVVLPNDATYESIFDSSLQCRTP